MLVLYDEVLQYLDYSKFIAKLESYGIRSTSQLCHVNSKDVSVKNLKMVSKEKLLLITANKINSDAIISKIACYNGIVSEINGNIGIVSLNKQNIQFWSELALHEALHLHGVHHCETHGCLMYFGICNGGFRYCLNCTKSCTPIHVCKVCKGVINGDRN